MAYVDEADLASTASGKGASMVGVKGGKTVQWEMLADAAALAALVPSVGDRARISGGGGDWVFYAGDYTAAVAIDTAKGAVVARSSDPYGNSGAWVRQVEGVLSPLMFGDLSDPNTNHATVQMAIDLAPYLKAAVAIPDRQIETRFPIFHVNYVTVYGDGPNSEIWNTYALPNGAKRTCWVMGVGQPAYFGTLQPAGMTEYASTALGLAGTSSGDMFYIASAQANAQWDVYINDSGSAVLVKRVYYTWYAGGAIADGAHIMTFSNPTDSENFAEGDSVFHRSPAYFKGSGRQEQPHYGNSNVVQLAGRGIAYEGGTAAFTAEATVTGGTSGATATIDHVIGGTAAGHLMLKDISGTFQNNETITGGGGSATVDGTLCGILTFRYPVKGVYPSSLICNQTQEVVIDTTTTSGDVFTGRQVSPCVQGKFLGVKLRQDDPDGHGFARSAPLDCDTDNVIQAPEGLWFNTSCFSRHRTVATITHKGVECAANCTSSVYTAYLNFVGESESPVVKFGECSNFNTVDLWLSGDFDGGTGIAAIEFDNGEGNLVNVNQMDVMQQTGAIIQFSSKVRYGGSTAYASWAALNAVVGAAGATATVPSDAGTHTDPVVGGTVDNAGLYTYSALPAGWERDGDIPAIFDRGEKQEPSRNNRVNVNCTINSGMPTRFIYLVDPAKTVTNCGVTGGRFMGTPTGTALTFGTSIHGGTNCYALGCYLQSGSIGTSLSVGAQIDVYGTLALSPNFYLGCDFIKVNGVDQHAAGKVVTHASGNFTLAMSSQTQTITVSGASITFNATSNTPLGGAAPNGATTRVTLTNASGVAWTPAFNSAVFNTNGWTPASIPAGRSITFVAKRVPSTIGEAVMILNPTAPA